MIRLTQQELDTHKARLAKLKAAGTVRTHRCGDSDEVAGQDRLQNRQDGAKQPRYGANGGKAVAKAVPATKTPQRVRNKAKQHVFPGLPPVEREYRFALPRKWRFDYAWPAQKIALEIEGGVWIQGRHTRGKGFLEDMNKYNEAGFLGWRVFRATPEQLKERTILNRLALILP